MVQVLDPRLHQAVGRVAVGLRDGRSVEHGPHLGPLAQDVVEHLVADDLSLRLRDERGDEPLPLLVGHTHPCELVRELDERRGLLPRAGDHALCLLDPGEHVLGVSEREVPTRAPRLGLSEADRVPADRPDAGAPGLQGAGPVVGPQHHHVRVDGRVVAVDRPRLVHPGGQVADRAGLHRASGPVVEPRAGAERLEQLVADDVLDDLVAAPGDVQDDAGVRSRERLPALDLRERDFGQPVVTRRTLLPQVDVGLLYPEGVSRRIDPGHARLWRCVEHQYVRSAAQVPRRFAHRVHLVVFGHLVCHRLPPRCLAGGRTRAPASPLEGVLELNCSVDGIDGRRRRCSQRALTACSSRRRQTPASRCSSGSPCSVDSSCLRPFATTSVRLRAPAPLR